MNSVEISIFALAMSLSVAASAGASSTIENDSNLGRNDTAERLKLQDCAARTGNDKVICDKELLKNRRMTPHDNSRLNTDRESGIKNGDSPTNTNNRDMQSPNSR
ncbi:MAG: hypothetical protein V4605_07435 [Pseudomonadota bacterium]